jgi:hypothetical protein
MLSEICPDIHPWADIAVALRCLRMGKIDVITYKYVIIFIFTILYLKQKIWILYKMMLHHEKPETLLGVENNYNWWLVSDQYLM